MDIKEEITKLVEEKIAGSDNFLVEVKVTPGKVLVTLDHPQGIMIEECVKVNRHLQAHFENTPVFEHRELEVGSPGMDGPAYGGRHDRYEVLLVLKDGSSNVFNTYS